MARRSGLISTPSVLQFRGSVVTADAGLLADRALDDALGLSETAGERLADTCTGKNGRYALVGMLRQAVFGRLAGYEDVNDAERLRHDLSACIVGDNAAPPPRRARWGFETKWLPGKSLEALVALSGQWVDRIHARRPTKTLYSIWIRA
jgi:hypothetical protein